jgi:hypothetical protein
MRAFSAVRIGGTFDYGVVGSLKDYEHLRFSDCEEPVWPEKALEPHSQSSAGDGGKHVTTRVRGSATDADRKDGSTKKERGDQKGI